MFTESTKPVDSWREWFSLMSVDNTRSHVKHSKIIRLISSWFKIKHKNIGFNGYIGNSIVWIYRDIWKISIKFWNDEKLIKTHRIYRKKLLKMTKEAIISYLNCLIANSKTQKYQEIPMEVLRKKWKLIKIHKNLNKN